MPLHKSGPFKNRMMPDKVSSMSKLGLTKSGKTIMSKFDHPAHANFTKKDHKDAGDANTEMAIKHTHAHTGKNTKYAKNAMAHYAMSK